ncbi:MCE family protein [Tomitella gaofuii]|uniref:MCE family protein n=1 Tax=Tomitella gaofuii TaxID=2760083 RepID=UPI0015F7D374|nr:MCE family protein [Tomitella gaofuii]
MTAGAGRTRRRWRVVAALLCVLALAVAAVWFVFVRGAETRRVVADFTHVEGVHPGSKVDVLGVPLGRVESVRPRGGAVRVTMTLREDVVLPADVNAYVMNPSVISARFIELGPVYRGGARYADGDVIPVERTHAPVNWDELLGSLDTIANALGPGGGDVGALIDQAAQATDGLGGALHRAIEQVGSATSLVGARADQIGALLDDLDRIAGAVGARQGRIADTVRSLAALGDELRRQDLDVVTPLTQLNSLFDRVGALLESRSGEVAEAIADARAVTGLLASKPANLAEFLDLTPLALQNIDRAIGPDERARLRLDVSSSGDQFATTQRICEMHPGPLCTAPGLTNPVPIPLSRSDPFGPLVERFGEEGR